MARFQVILLASSVLAGALVISLTGAPAQADVKQKKFRFKDVKRHIKPTKIERGGSDSEVGLRWTDKNGDNFFVFTHTVHQDAVGASLRGHLYAGRRGKFKRLRLLRDDFPSGSECQEEERFSLNRNSLLLTDLDEDGIAEVTFGYWAAGVRQKNGRCLQRYKLVLLEGKKKYIFRGLVDHPEFGTGGDFKPQPAEAKWPAGAYAHHQKMWKKTAVVPDGTYPHKVASARAWQPKRVKRAAAAGNHKRCEKWLTQPRTNKRDDWTCAVYWMINEGFHGDTYGHLDMPWATSQSPRFIELSAERLLLLADKARAACNRTCRKDSEVGPAEMASRMFREAARGKLSPRAYPKDIKPVLRLLLAGEPLTISQGIVSGGTLFQVPDLRLLLHAVYARHGKRFADPDLNAFFYEAEPAVLTKHFPDALEKRRAIGLLPVNRKRRYKDSMLTRIDRENIKRIEKSIESQTPNR